MKALTVLVLPAVMAVGFFYVGVRVAGDLPQSQKHPEGVVWGKRTFENRAALGRWLRSRGMSYEAWTRRHPVPTRVKPARNPPSPTRSELLIGVAVLAGLAIAFLVTGGRHEWAVSDGRHVLIGTGHALGASSGRVRSAATITMRRHPDLGWWLVGGALVAAAAVVVAQWS
jgi:hypothetical protein